MGTPLGSAKVATTVFAKAADLLTSCQFYRARVKVNIRLLKTRFYI